MKINTDSLLYFDSPTKFYSFVEELGLHSGWRIEEGLLNERGKQIVDKDYTLMLRELFWNKGFFRKNVSLAEIVSWLDNLTLVYRLLRKLELEVCKEIFEEISISVEYMIEMSKRMRIDYMLVYHNSILLLEMRTVNSFNKMRSTWEKKFHELLVYKELLGNYCTSKIKLYALVSLYEFKGKTKILRHIDNNEKQLNYLVRYIKKYLVN